MVADQCYYLSERFVCQFARSDQISDQLISGCTAGIKENSSSCISLFGNTISNEILY